MTTPMPVITLLLVGAGVLTAMFPGLSSWLIYDRHAILSGEVWRMFTGHWVHFSTQHLLFDSLALGVAGWIIESKRLPKFGWLCVLTPWHISSVLLLVEREMTRYAGLSGIATAAIVYLALWGLTEKTSWRFVCATILVGLVGKIIAEMTTGHAVFVTVADSDIRVSGVSHVVGAVIAWMFYACLKTPKLIGFPAK